MKYDYMNKERPNIYHPSRAGVRGDPSITKSTHAANNRSIDNNGDDETLRNSPESSITIDANQMYGDSMHANGTEQYNFKHDGCNGELYEGKQRERNSDLDCDVSLRKVPAAKKKMPSIEEQLHEAVRSLNEHQMQTTMANRRSQSALKMYATSNGLGSIIEKLSVDDSDANAPIVESPLKEPQVIVNNSGLDANAKNMNVPSSNIRHEMQDSHAKKPMSINSRNNIRPEENWRHRSNSNSLENKQPTSKCTRFIYFA